MNTYRIPNLARACQALKLFAGSDAPLSSSDVARQLEMPRTTALRILMTFCEEGFLVRDGHDFRAGPELARLGLRALGAAPLRERALPILRALAQETGETAHVAVLSGAEALILEVCESPNPVHAVSRPGTLAAIHCSATGKALLAFAVGPRRSELLRGARLERRTPHTLTSLGALEEACAEIERRGYAIDDEEYHVGVRCLAAPVRDARGEVVAAIGITAPVATFTKRRIPEVAQAVLRAAAALSEAAPRVAASAG
jgi:IclR family acetate operon transcriptional repressor